MPISPLFRKKLFKAQIGWWHLPKMEIHQKMKVVALIEHYKVDQLTMVISSLVVPKKAKYF
jgi:hypothetical protein